MGRGASRATVHRVAKTEELGMYLQGFPGVATLSLGTRQRI